MDITIKKEMTYCTESVWSCGVIYQFSAYCSFPSPIHDHSQPPDLTVSVCLLTLAPLHSAMHCDYADKHIHTCTCTLYIHSLLLRVNQTACENIRKFSLHWRSTLLILIQHVHACKMHSTNIISENCVLKSFVQSSLTSNDSISLDIVAVSSLSLSLLVPSLIPSSSFLPSSPSPSLSGKVTIFTVTSAQE